MIILQDSREKQPLSFPGHEVRVKALKVGDYAGGLGTVERKGGGDFAACLLRSERRKKFDAQLVRLAEYAGHPLLVAELLTPTVFKRLHPGLVYAGYERAFTRFLDECPIPVVYSSGPTESAAWVIRWLTLWSNA